MLRNLGVYGIAGIVLLLAGVGLVAYENLIVAAGIALIVAGIGMVARGLVTGMLKSFGMY